jgi:hypothetical protein
MIPQLGDQSLNNLSIIWGPHKQFAPSIAIYNLLFTMKVPLHFEIFE